MYVKGEHTVFQGGHLVYSVWVHRVLLLFCNGMSGSASLVLGLAWRCVSMRLPMNGGVSQTSFPLVEESG